MIKRLISKLFKPKELNCLDFWEDLDRKEKIKKLAQDLEFFRLKINSQLPNVDCSDFKQIYHIAQLQQKLLTTKTGN